MKSKYRRLFTLPACLAIGINVCATVSAADFYWDSDNDATGNLIDGTSLGGAGTINTASLQWWDGIATNVTTAAGPQSTGPNTIIFKGTAGAVAVASLNDADINTMTINSAYTFTGTAAVGSTSLHNFTYDVAGTNALDMSNLTLSGSTTAATTRTFTVGDNDSVTVKAGSMATLVKNGNGSLIFADGTTFNSNSHNMTLNAGLVSIGTGANNFVRDNGGSFRLTLTNGATLQSRADVNLGNGSGASDGAAISISGTGSLEVQGSTTMSHRGNLSWLQGSGTLTKTGTGTLALENGRRTTSGKNYTGNVVVSQGNLVVYDDVAKSSAIDKVTSTFTAATDTLTFSSAPGFATGDKVVLNTSSTSGISSSTHYFIKNVGGNDFQLYTDGALASIVDITADGTTAVRLIRISTLGNSTTSTISLGDANSGSNAISFLTGPLASGSSRDIRVERNITVANQGGTVTLGGNADVNSIFSGTITLNKNVTLTSAATGGNTVNFSGVISGAADVNLSSTGNVTFSADHTYSGNTTVPTGANLTLADDASLKFAIPATSGGNTSLSGAGTVALDGDFEIDTALPEAAALTSGTWILENVPSLGAYGGNFQVTSGGTPWSFSGDVWTKTVGAQTYSFNEATGTLTLGAGAGSYTTWAAANSTSSNPNEDSDNDGISNALEYAVGTANPTGSDGSLGVFSMGNLSFTKRAEAFTNGDVTYRIEFSTDLGITDSWDVVPSYTANNASTIAADLPTDSAKNFARLRVIITP